MLYDPKWEVQTKPDVFSLEGLIAWLETMPADGEYCFFDNGGCLLHQYFSAVGLDIGWVGGLTFTHIAGGLRHKRKIPEAFRNVANGIKMDGIEASRTFGTALDRARKALAS